MSKNDEEFDPYIVLNIDRNVQSAQIKSQFRKLAKIYHPDKNPGDETALRQYRKLSLAHDLLTNKEKRDAFDDGLINCFGKPVDTALRSDDIKFTGKSARRYDLKGPNLHFQMTIDMAVALNGGRKKLRRKNGKKLDIVIPKGTRSGDIVQLHAQGSHKGALDSPGDAFVEFLVRDEFGHRLIDDDLFFDIPISLSEAAFGKKKLKVKTISGDIELDIPAKSNSGDHIVIKNKGWWIDDSKRGNLIGRLMITLPNKWDPELLSFLKQKKR